MSEQLTLEQRQNLVEIIRKTFNVRELKALSFRFGIDVEELAWQTKGEFVRELVAYFERHGVLEDLLLYLEKERPNIDWPEVTGVKKQESQEHFPIYLQEPGLIPPQRQFIGREALVAEINGLVGEGQRLLLHGLIGAGKSAIAEKVGDDHIERGDGGVIWFKIDNLAADPLFNALANRFGTKEEKQEIGQVQNEADILAVRSMLERYRPSLLIIDNARNGPALEALLDALPEGMPALVTSQYVFPIAGLRLTSISDLSEEDALAVFSHYAGRDYRDDALAAELCKALAYHPYSLEIAGAVVKPAGRISRRWLEKIVEAPTNVAPEFGSKPALTALLEESYGELSETAKAVFRKIGSLSVSGATPELLALLLDLEVVVVWEALVEITNRSLARRQQIDWLPADSEDIEHYDFHELTYQFSRLQFQEQAGSETELIDSICRYGHDMKWNPAYLQAEIGNVIAAARMAEERGESDKLVTIVSGLALNGYLEIYGHTVEIVHLLDAAIEAVKNGDDEQKKSLPYLVGKRGNVYFDRGQFEEARRSYEEVLRLTPYELKLRKVMALAVLGKVCYQLKQYSAGDDYFERGHRLVSAPEDEVALGFLYQQQSVAKGLAEEYEASRNFGEKAVQINRQFAETNPPRYLFSLLNLGTAEERLGNFEKAIEIHTAGYEMALEKGQKRLAADMAFSLAQDLHEQGRDEQIKDKLEKARRLYNEAGEIALEQSVVNFMKQVG